MLGAGLGGVGGFPSLNPGAPANPSSPSGFSARGNKEIGVTSTKARTRDIEFRWSELCHRPVPEPAASKGTEHSADRVPQGSDFTAQAREGQRGER